MRISNNYCISASPKIYFKQNKSEICQTVPAKCNANNPPKQSLINTNAYIMNFNGRVKSYSKKQIEQIQSGKISQVISSGELTTSDVIQVLDSELELIKPEDIRKIVNSFPKEDRPLAMRALFEMAEFTNYNDFISLSKYIKNKSVSLVDINSDNILERGILTTDLLHYLYGKDEKNIEYPSDINSAMDYKSPLVVLLDDYTLSVLQQNPELRELVRSTDRISILYPQGFINGINPFNQESLEGIKERTEKVVATAKTIIQTENMPPDKAVQKALNQPIQDKLDELGLGNKLQIIKNPDKPQGQANENSVAKKLEPKKMSKEELDAVMETIPENDRQLVLRMIAMCAHVFSTRSLSSICKTHYNKLLKLADSLGIKQENIYFIQDYNNHSATTLLYQATNKIGFERFIRDSHERLGGGYFSSNKKAPPLTLPKNSMIVMLDDNSGTGSQASATISGNNHWYQTEKQGLIFVFSPLVCSSESQECNGRYNNREEGYFLPGIVYSDASFEQSLSEEEKNRIKKIKHDSGYKHLGGNFAFPHMSPDYNNVFFYTNIADKYTFSKSAIKTQELVDSYTYIDEYVL